MNFIDLINNNNGDLELTFQNVGWGDFFSTNIFYSMLSSMAEVVYVAVDLIIASIVDDSRISIHARKSRAKSDNCQNRSNYSYFYEALTR